MGDKPCAPAGRREARTASSFGQGCRRYYMVDRNSRPGMGGGAGRGAVSTMLTLIAVSAAIALGAMPSAVWAQGVVGDEVFFQAAAFRIPFNVPQGAQVYRAKLFVSRD